MTEHTAEIDAPEVITEYAIVRNRIVLYGPTREPGWNERITLHDAVERWYPGGVVVTRTRTIYPDVLTEWTRVTPPEQGQP